MTFYYFTKACIFSSMQKRTNILFRRYKSGNTNADFIANCKILGLTPKGVDQETVRRAFVNLCKKFHPDSGGKDANIEKFNQVK